MIFFVKCTEKAYHIGWTERPKRMKIEYGEVTMKLQHLEYVIAIAQAGSITGAAKKLYQAQPNISIALKELEAQLGIQIFWRTPNGMILTPEGEEFFLRAKKIVSDIHALESEFVDKTDSKVAFKVATTRSSYVTAGIGYWINELNKEGKKYSVHFMETNTHQVIEDTGSGKADIGVIRVPAGQTELYAQQLATKNLTEQVLMEFPMRILMGKNHPLAKYDDIPFEELKKYPEILHGDEDVNLFRKTFINPEYASDSFDKIIYVYDRGSKITMLLNVENSYMWVSPVPMQNFEDDRMVLKESSYACIPNRDLIIFKKNSANDKLIKSCIKALADFTDKVMRFPDNK